MIYDATHTYPLSSDEIEELGGSKTSRTGEVLSESSTGNDCKVTEVTDEPTEQDSLESCSSSH